MVENNPFPTQPGNALTYLPLWLHDETLYSFACRYHLRACNAHPRFSAQQLFGSERAGGMPAFPAGLDHLAAIGEGHLGSSLDIIRDHSVLPFFLPFVDAEHRQAALTALQGPPTRSLTDCLGLRSAEFRTDPPLRACPQCREADRASFGIAYWHRRHQLPGVVVCTLHGGRLEEAAIAAPTSRRFPWLLPDQVDWMADPLGGLSDGERTDLLACCREIALVAEGIAALPADFGFDRAHLRTAYREAIREQGGLTPAGSLRAARWGGRWIERYRQLRSLPDFAALPATAEEAARILSRWLDKPRTGAHPLRHLLLIHFLFGTWEAFRIAYRHCTEGASTGPELPPTPPEPPKPIDPRRQRLVELLTVERRSLRHAALALAIDIATAAAWAAAAGLETSRRPSTIHDELRNAIIARLRAGDDQSAIAGDLGVSVASVYRVLRTEPGLPDVWDAARTAIKRTEMRAALLEFIANHPEHTRNQVARQCGPAWKWLYRHDREWLEAHLPEARPKGSGPRRRLDWDARDDEWLQRVNEVAETLRDRYAGPIPSSILLQALPELRPKWGHLERLPKTRERLGQLTGRIGRSKGATGSASEPEAGNPS